MVFARWAPVFAALKKIINDDCLESLNTKKTWENFLIVLNLKFPGLKRRLHERFFARVCDAIFFKGSYTCD